MTSKYDGYAPAPTRQFSRYKPDGDDFGDTTIGVDLREPPSYDHNAQPQV